MSYDFTIQGVYELLTLNREAGERLILCFHTVEDGTAGGAYWVLAERDAATGRWHDLTDRPALPRVHGRDRERIVRRERVTRFDAEAIVFLGRTAREN